VVTIFLATFVAGSFLNQVQLFISAPKSILRILGAAAPQTASFFMSYLLLLGLTTKPILFLRIPRAPPASPFSLDSSFACASMISLLVVLNKTILSIPPTSVLHQMLRFVCLSSSCTKLCCLPLACSHQVGDTCTSLPIVAAPFDPAQGL
jgi:hypothetical protein